VMASTLGRHNRPLHTFFSCLLALQ